ncbi:MAG TPA: HAD family hydrolase [Syntrophales bacterium]|nr:HAD family hydrolase [Syntrophales bacterium]
MKNRNPIRAIIFDFDGTLAKLNINFTQMRNSVMNLIGSYRVPVNGLTSLFVLEMIDAAEALISHNCPGKEKKFIQQANELITNIEIESAKKGELIDGTRNMLIELKKRNIKVGVVTRNCELAVTHIFPDILKHCDTVITREMIPNVKPHPEHLIAALRLLGVAPEFSSMVGDHPMDIKIGKDVGTLTIGVLSGYSTANDLLEAGADIIINKAADIPSVLP